MDPATPVVAVCLSVLVPEARARAADRRGGSRALPGAEVSLSHEVSPVWREYERASTTIADAFVKPRDRSLRRRESDGSSREQLALERWNLLGSNGGYLSAEEARRRPAQLLLSGLAGGVIGGKLLRRGGGHPVGVHAGHGRDELRPRP